jgi:hypothetical protein
MPYTRNGVLITNATLTADGEDVGAANPLPVTSAPAAGSPLLDAFGRSRVSEPFTLFDSQFHYDKQPLLWDEALTGGAGAASHNANQHCVDLTLGTTSGHKIGRQTFQRHRYQPGKSQLIFLTGVFVAQKANVRTRVGYFDVNNGVFFENNGTDGPRFVKRSSGTGAPVDTPANQAAWSYDSMDGNGPSGITLDFDTTQILVIDIEWLGVGSVRFGFVVDGALIWAHQMNHANNLALPYMQTACLPLRYEIENTGLAASGTTLKQVCGTVISEGGFNPKGVVRYVGRSITGFTLPGVGAGNRYNVITTRLKSTRIGAMIVPLGFSCIADSNSEYLIELVLNPTIGGAPAFVSAGANSIAEYDVTGTTVAGGETLWAELVTRESKAVNVLVESSINLGASIANVADRLTLAITQRAAAAATVTGGVMIKELV